MVFSRSGSPFRGRCFERLLEDPFGFADGKVFVVDALKEFRCRFIAHFGEVGDIFQTLPAS
jgi:hypothetical protein